MHARRNTGLWAMFCGFVLTILVLAGMVASERLGWMPGGDAGAIHRSP